MNAMPRAHDVLRTDPSASGLAAMPVVSAKLMPPSPRATELPREALCERLCAAGPQVVVLSAAAGFGKSTLLAQCHAYFEAHGQRTLWLTLDRADNDVPRLLRCLALAAGRAADVVGEPDADVMALLADLQGPWALFLDEFEHLQDPGALGLMRALVEKLPRQGRLFVAARGTPDLELAPLRARQQVLVIDERDLRFDAGETTCFLQRHLSYPLAAQDCETLQRKTEGWAGALMLAAQALERHGPSRDFIERICGSQGDIAQYLGEEVLAQQPAALRDFLLRTSVLRCLEPGLCEALNPRVDSRQVLAWLEEAHLLVTPLDSVSRCWRYHGLFADFLRSRLHSEQPQQVARLHLAAAAWYETQGRPVPAIEHSIEGGDWPLALQLLERYVDTFLEQGRFRLLSRWFDLLPAHALCEHPLLQAAQAWALCMTKGPAAAQACSARHGLADHGSATVQAHWGALQPVLLAMQDRYDEAVAAGRRALALPPSGSLFVDGTLANVMAHAAWVTGQSDVAAQWLNVPASPGGPFNRMYQTCTQGLIEWQRGRLRQAMALFRLALGLCRRSGSSHGNAWAGVLYAVTLYEINDLEAADRLLTLYLPPCRDAGLPDHVIGSYVIRSRIAFERGDVDRAARWLVDLEHLGGQRGVPRLVVGARLERSRQLLLQGNAQGARKALQWAADDASWRRVGGLSLPAHETDDLLIGALRWDVTFGDADAASHRIVAAHAEAHATNRHRRALKLSLLGALAAWRLGQQPAAVAQCQALLHETSREGTMRLLLDEGPALVPLLRRCRAEAPRGPGVRDPIFVDHLDQLLAAYAADHPEHDRATPDSDDALTPKELLVLQLLDEGCSNRVLCERLLISDSTARTHLRKINQKLGAQSRAQAVSIGRRRGLVG